MNRSQEKILLGTIIIIIVGIVIVLFLAFQQRDKVNVISARIDDTRDKLSRLSNLYNKVLDHAGSVRTYVLSDDQNSLPIINSTADSITMHLAALKSIYHARSEKSSDIDSLEKYLTKRIDHSNHIVTEAKTKGNAAAVTLYETGHGREYNNQIFFITNRMQGNEMEMLSQQEASNSTSIKSLTNYLVELLIIILVMTVLIVLKIRTDLHERRIFNEKRDAEEALRKSESRYRSLIEQANDAIMITDEKGNFIDVNGSFCKQFGYSKEEMLKSNISLVMDPVSLEKDPVRFDLLLLGQPILRERKMVRKDGTIIEVEANVKMLPDGRVLAIARDITERKKAHELIMKEKTLSDLIINTLPGIFYFFDEHGKYIRWNKNLETVTGYTSKEIYEMNSLDFFDDIEKEKVVAEINKAFEKGHGEVEATFETKSGQRLLYYFNAISTEYEGKKCILGMGLDISDQKKAENELIKSYREIRLLTTHLQKIREDERMHIAREIHDELGQQLTVLKMDASWLNKKLSGEDHLIKERLTGLLELLDETVNSVRRISSELRPSLLDDLGLVAAMEWHLKDFEKRSGIRVNFSADESELTFPDEVKTGLFRILQESLTNVARHASAKNVSVSFQKDNGHLILRIQDDGKGFDPHKVRDKKTLGILGMKERSLMMGGIYNITSDLDKGTIVVLSIPHEQN